MSILKRPGWGHVVIREARHTNNSLRQRIQDMYDRKSLAAKAGSSIDDNGKTNRLNTKQGCSYYTITKIMNTLAIQNPEVKNASEYTDDQIRLAVNSTAALHKRDFIPREYTADEIEQQETAASQIIDEYETADLTLAEIKEKYSGLTFKIQHQYDVGDVNQYIYKSSKYDSIKDTTQVITLTVASDHGETMSVNELWSGDMMSFTVEQDGKFIVDMLFNHATITNELDRDEEPDLTEAELRAEEEATAELKQRISNVVTNKSTPTEKPAETSTKSDIPTKFNGKIFSDEDEDGETEEDNFTQKEEKQPAKSSSFTAPKFSGKIFSDEDEEEEDKKKKLEEKVKLSPQAMNRLLQEKRIKDNQRRQLIEEKYRMY